MSKLFLKSEKVKMKIKIKIKKNKMKINKKTVPAQKMMLIRSCGCFSAEQEVNRKTNTINSKRRYASQ